ncbi:MAG TPA: alkaline phosphatase family protein [Gemmatimonadaceae bacterium]|nr:alkaline phosphatase family protein [Gemmatimonadaceae bacterium]
MTHAAAASTGLPKIGHVFIVVLENEDVLATYGPNSPATYLIDTLAPMGTFLSQYYGIGHASLDNYTALVSGQAPDSSTSADCDIYTNFVPRGPHGGWNTTTGQIAGEGCIYPKDVWTIGQQLAAAHLTWKGYMEDMGNDPSREAATCGHVPIGTEDITNNEEPEDQYAARHNPFVWFHSIIDGAACNNVVPLTPLENDLKTVATTPNYSFITPNVCNDGHDAPCVTGEPGGLVQANRWLKKWVPLILSSPAFKQDGLLIIISDEAEGTNGSVACCGEQPGPNEALPGGDGPGGGDVGAVAISRFITPGGFDDTQYNHYSLLASVFNIFQLQKFGQHQLGYAGAPGLPVFGADVFTNPSGTVSAERVKLGPSVSSAALLAKHGYLQISAK